MPASVNEAISASLHMSLWHSKTANLENGESMLHQRMATVSKMLPDIAYETSSDTYYSSVLQNLKAKYNAEGGPSTSNGNGCTDAVRDNVLPTPAKILYPIEKVQMGWLEDKNCRVGSGFSNAGNTCYLNSVLQALFHIPPLYNWLLYGDQEHQKTCSTFRNCSQECIVCCVAMTLRASQNGAGEMRPGLILSKLRFICKRLIPGQQEDAMEFLRYLFEAMEKSFLHRFNGQKIDNRSKETTPLNQIFGGYIRTEVTCMSCHAVSTTFQHFLDLTLDITRAFSLDNALEYYFAQERLEENSYRCEKCKKKVPATKQFFIERPPNVLCVQLKRFSIEGKKIGKGIKLNERINLNRYKSRVNGANQRGANYRLVAGVNHLGHSAQSGHYTTLAYAPNNNLYLYDDGCVQQAWQRTFSGSDVYLLMYVLEPKKQFDNSLKSPSTATHPQNKEQIRRLPGVSPKPSTSTATSFSAQSPKPGIIFNQNRKFLPSSVPGYSGNTNGKVESPVKKIVNLNNLNRVEMPTNGCSSKSEEAKVSKPEQSPLKTNMKFIGPSMPSLVPYQDDHSSDEEEQKTPKKPEVNNIPKPCVSNPDTAKPTIRPADSPKKPQVASSQSSSTLPKEEPAATAQSLDGSLTSAKSDFSVKSTSSLWNVSTADKNLPHQLAKPSPVSNWVVTVASKSQNKSKSASDGEQPKEKETLKRKHESNGNVEMEWIEKPNHKLQVNGVTNHRNGVSSTTSNSNPRRQDQYGPLLPNSVASTLLRTSHKGYGGADVKSWEGHKSNVDKQVNEDFWMNKRDKDTSCDYDDEIDAGKSKKLKTHHLDQNSSAVDNLFQKEADRRRIDARPREYERSRDNDRRRDTRPYSSHHNHHDRHRMPFKHQSNNRFDRRHDQRSNGHHRDGNFRHGNKFQNNSGFRRRNWDDRY